MKHLSSFISSILAGVAIGLGGVVYLSIENTVLGALFFTVGLFTICTLGLNLFTGKVCYIFDNKPAYTLWTLTIWLGNLVGTSLVALAVRAARIAGITQRAAAICEIKLNDTSLSVFILAILCNMLIFIAVDNYKNCKHEIGKYLGLFFGVMVFILSGYEHCIADMFYFSVSGAWNLHTVIYLLIITAGNAVGGVVFPLYKKFSQIEEKQMAYK